MYGASSGEIAPRVPARGVVGGLDARIDGYRNGGAEAPRTPAGQAGPRRRHVLVFGVVAWSLGTGLGVIAGVLLVVALVQGLPLVVDGIKPLAELARALLPLTLPCSSSCSWAPTGYRRSSRSC
jgi:hypothetical protein